MMKVIAVSIQTELLRNHHMSQRETGKGDWTNGHVGLGIGSQETYLGRGLHGTPSLAKDLEVALSQVLGRDGRSVFVIDGRHFDW